MMNPNTPPDSAPCGLKPDPTCRVKSETPHHRRFHLHFTPTYGSCRRDTNRDTNVLRRRRGPHGDELGDKPAGFFGPGSGRGTNLR